jgi:Na+/H+ antiporter NhaA
MSATVTIGRQREFVTQFAAPLLLLATVAALAWASSPLGDTYTEFWSIAVALQFRDLVLGVAGPFANQMSA